MKMVVISADEYEKLKNEKKESETKIESYKQCIAGYESRIKELTEERDKLKDSYFDMYKKLTADNKRLAKTVLNSAYGVEQDICCRISNNLNRSMFDKISQLSDENEKLKKESAEKSEWLKIKDETLDNLIIGYNKLEKEHKELKTKSVSFDCHKKLIEDNEQLADENRKLEVKVSSLRTQLNDSDYVLKELRQKYEAVLKTNEKLAAENSRLANDPEIIRLNNELKILKKQYKDLNNAYKSQKNELLKLKNKPIDYARIKLVCKEYEDRLNKIESLANV